MVLHKAQKSRGFIFREFNFLYNINKMKGERENGHENA